MTKWNGWAGAILEVDLTSGDIKKVAITEEFAAKYIGGTGFGAKYLYDHLKPGTDPLGPDNILIVANGTLSGTTAPSCGRYDIITKSPQTGIYLRTNGGGNFGPEMKWAGYDLIVVRGASSKPVYLWIDNDHIEIRDATQLWGKDVWETQELIRKELRDPEVQSLKIGPSGENLGISSCVIGNLGRAAGKGAAGAVMGSKKLKAIAIRGTQGTNIAHPEEFLKACEELQERFRQDPVYDAIRAGSPRYVSDPLCIKGDYVPGWNGKGLLSSEFDSKYYQRSQGGCFGCPISCSSWYVDKNASYKERVGVAIEGNAVVFGGMVLRVDNPAFVCRYNTACNQLGLHVDTPGLAIAWAMKLYEAGIITQEDTDGIELTWGNEDAIIKMVYKIAYRDGFGDILDSYPLRAAEKLGRGSLAYVEHGKGMTGHGSGILVSAEFTLAHGVSIRGYDHLVGAPSWPAKINKIPGATDEVLGKIGEKLGDRRLSTEVWYKSPKKALFVADFENTSTLCDITGACKHASIRGIFTNGWDRDTFAKFLTLATGVIFTEPDVVAGANREMLIERAFNAREGIRRMDDYPLPYYWQLKYGEPHPKYIGVAFPITMDEYGQLLDAYYEVRGCDQATGIPSRKKLEELGLADIADDLEKYGCKTS